jgi:hypothetical protein
MAIPLSLRERVARKVPRLAKAARQWSRVVATGKRPDTRVVFIVGSQRSGTRLPLQLLARSPHIATFSEGATPFFNGILLQPLARLEQLVRRSPAPVVALKPICETHRVHELLDHFPGSKAIWIFRHYAAAVNSASIKWTSGRENVRRLAHGDLDKAGWRAGGLTPEKLRIVRELYRPDMSLLEANAVMWYLRNGLFFDLGADVRPDVMLVRYEDIVADPQGQFDPVFRFIGTPTPDDLDDVVRGGQERRRAEPLLSNEIREACEALHQRLLRHHRSSDVAASV